MVWQKTNTSTNTIRDGFLTLTMSVSRHSKASDLEEELKNVTNNLKSLEAQSEKVRAMCTDTRLQSYLYIYFRFLTALLVFCLLR